MRTPHRVVGRALPALTAVTLGAAACTGSGSVAAEQVARNALQASAAHDTTKLCSLLAPSTAQSLEREQSTPCEQAAQSLSLGQPSTSGPAEVWGSSALVPTGSTSVFLTEVDGRWRVLAAGCSMHKDSPADCEVGGG